MWNKRGKGVDEPNLDVGVPEGGHNEQGSMERNSMLGSKLPTVPDDGEGEKGSFYEDLKKEVSIEMMISAVLTSTLAGR